MARPQPYLGEPLARSPAPTARGGSWTKPTIITGLDGSGPSWDALSWACGEARRLGGRAIAVFVSPCLDVKFCMASATGFGAVECALALSLTNAEHAARLRGEIESRGAGDRDLDLAFIQAWGDPGQELVRIAEEVKADVIAVGRSTKIRHRLAGSVGRRLLAKRGMPIIVVVP
jgi:nucleotide-binding universal stress UspA family protein